MKIRPLEAELFHADGRTDVTKLIVAFYSFAKAPIKLETVYLNNFRTREHEIYHFVRYYNFLL